MMGMIWLKAPHLDEDEEAPPPWCDCRLSSIKLSPALVRHLLMLRAIHECQEGRHVILCVGISYKKTSEVMNEQRLMAELFPCRASDLAKV